MSLLSLDLDAMSYGPAPGTVPVLGQLHLDVSQGETVAITGPSGVGKTTLLRILAGLEDRFDGRLSRTGRFAMVFQEPVLLPWRNARDNVVLTTGVTASEAEARLAEVGLHGLEARHPGQLSLGQQRRLALARAFAVQPDLLLMDEPFVSLDAETGEEIMTLFERLRAENGAATVLVTHAESEATRLAERVLRLSGTPARFVPEMVDA